ncbi:hypothetical protein [uncultured Helicobacter sp.]|uniref:hypothetical protein n=1 Tax=uncultured Helicobacter sp. TaxID=175537 RepID=UPI00374EB0C1
MASNIASAAMWAAVFTPTADEIAKEIVAEEARLRALEEKAYWEGWDKGCKEKVIQRLRNHEEGLNFLTLQKQPIYPDMTQDEQADLIERGELKIVAPIKETGPGGLLWADETREEAQNATYLKLKEILEKNLGIGTHRVVL